MGLDKPAGALARVGRDSGAASEAEKEEKSRSMGIWLGARSFNMTDTIRVAYR